MLEAAHSDVCAEQQTSSSLRCACCQAQQECSQLCITPLLQDVGLVAAGAGAGTPTERLQRSLEVSWAGGSSGPPAAVLAWLCCMRAFLGSCRLLIGNHGTTETQLTAPSLLPPASHTDRWGWSGCAPNP